MSNSCKLVFNFDEAKSRRIPLSFLDSLCDLEIKSLVLYKQESKGDKAYSGISLSEVKSYTTAVGKLETLYKFWNKKQEYSILGGASSEYGVTWFLIMESSERMKQTNRILKRVAREQAAEEKASKNLEMLEELKKKLRDSQDGKIYEDMMKEYDDLMKKTPYIPADPWKTDPLNPSLPIGPGWPLPESPGLPRFPWTTTDSSDEYVITTTTGTSYAKTYITSSRVSFPIKD